MPRKTTLRGCAGSRPERNAAVFSHSIPKERSHFEIDYCCTTDPTGENRVFDAPAAYTVNMAVDPDTVNLPA